MSESAVQKSMADQAGSAPPPEPAAAEPAPVADGQPRRLDPRYIPLQKIVGGIVTAVISPLLLIGVTVLVFSAALPFLAAGFLALLWAFASAGLAWLGYRWPAIEYRHTSYTVDGRGIEIRRGVIWRSVINVPRSRVQHTDVSQGPLERRYGLGTVVIYTAGTDFAQVALPGLDHATALRIRDHLLPRDAADAV
jgi:membrane protein YdbS with pleckstrin-like domain